MYLKKVEIHGFKSFADRVEVEFEKGVTGIVGPNGSGKSNISDAVRWVLGEQSAKTLRGSKMEDIIFAGTTQRKPVGMAEVSMTLDNSENILPIDYAEVTVTRRVYRSGESEYLINKTPCRLKDIREMLMDTGIGIDGYSIIGQGRIDEILSNKSEDRRLIFEEAAGIVKYKTRKEEAEKKLENTNQNLTRVDDIIQELENRIDPLRIQSEKAKNFIQLREELKDVEINLYIHELDDLRNKIETMKEQEEVILGQLQHYTHDKKQIDEQHKGLKVEIECLENRIQQLQSNIFEATNLLEKKDGEISLYHEKVSNVAEYVARLNLEITQIENEKKSVENQLGEKLQELENYKMQLKDGKQEVYEKEKELEQFIQLLVRHEQDIEHSTGNMIELLNQSANKKSEMNSLISLRSNLSKRCQQLSIEIEEIKEKQQNTAVNIEKILGNLGAKTQQLESSKRALAELRIDLGKAKQLAVEMKKKCEYAKQKMQEKQTKKNLLEEMQKDYEGFNKSVKNTLQETKKNAELGKNIYGVVAELIEVPKELEVAIEVALGSSLQNIVCQRAEDANRVIGHLKKNNLGRVTFLPIDSIRIGSFVSAATKEDIRRMKGFVGYASEVIRYDAYYKDIFQYLLGKVILVDKIENGIVIAKATGHKLKIVSLEGDIINPGGSITGGSYHAKTVNFLSRRREIDELEQEISLERKNYEDYERQFSSKETLIHSLENQIQAAESELKNAEIHVIHEKNDYEQLKKEEKMYLEQIMKSEKEIQQLMEEQENITVSLEIKEREIEQLQKDQDTLQKLVSVDKDQYDLQKSKKEEMSEQLTGIKIKMASLKQQIQNLEHQIEEIERRNAESLDLKVKKEMEIEALLQNKLSYEKQLDRLAIESKDIDVLRQQYEFNLTQLRGDKADVSKRFDAVAEQLEKINEITSELQDSRYKIEVKRTRLEIQQESYCNKLWEDYEMTYLEAMEYKKDNILMGESTKKIKILKEKIKELGAVNLDAIQEYQEVIERYEFLTNQRFDLIHAKESLHGVIKEMETTMKEQFIVYFEKIRENFDQVFKQLFGGGKAELKLVDESEILTTGIEINAQPPGKKLQHLSLLSGGERALTAISLLFAILKVKPTPFCILDEIEAALDDANVYRYADFLKEFSKDTQFIVVTHRKGTMECVDALYGVTMQEYGVSKLVSVKLTDKAS
ncbi:chromosome segregation protein SMC [Geosporobacter ferrireducens]|uniref:Chromosome partition protein Smc n=1 Tax=Geosporobacter ferrireducens TaxID=1424294 RepID=A0A1D8GPS1_9FIRM|nr:chromosome segregation protein SMC [Geosporobacter ferrireducens]AOT72942.1 chromosome segregation protein SMC [Geosporobacter ferrireducens]